MKQIPWIFSLSALMVVPAAAVESSEKNAVQAPLAGKSLQLDGCLAGDRIVTAGERGIILFSDDQGVSWHQAEVPTRATLTAVYFQNENLGFVVGHDAVILKSTDGGIKWSLLYAAPDEERPLFDVLFVDDRNGFAVGAYGLFLKTRDAGMTWSAEPVSGDDYHLNKIGRSENGTLFIAGEAGRIYVSDDAGRTWREVISPYPGSFYGLLPIHEGPTLVFGLRGNLFQYRENGDTWEQVVLPVNVLLTDACETADGNIVIVGMGGMVFLSKDKGRTFSAIPRADRLNLSAVTQAKDGALILIGEYGSRRLELSD